MAERVLITGGAGFIGSHLARRLLESGRDVRVLDSLIEQVHGPPSRAIAAIADGVDLRVADVRDRSAMQHALDDVDVVVHLAAETGTGQSMSEIHRYVDANVGGTAIVLEVMADRANAISKLVVASSRAVYGEGKYYCASDGVVLPRLRTADALRAGRWEPSCPICGGPISPLPTDEDSQARPSSTYGVTKLAQELLAGTFSAATGVPTVVLRYQNVYGPGQSLSNPYTGILPTFVNALLAGASPAVFEDGQESRDFVHVADAVEATYLALNGGATGVINIGSGHRTTLLELAQLLARLVAPSLQPRVTGEFRAGDVRHALADIARARDVLGWQPATRLEPGLADFVQWVVGQRTVQARQGP